MVRCAKCCSSSKGKLDLDAPAKRYAPEIGKLQVIEGFDAKGEPMLRAPKRDITTRMLMTHTAGLSYDFINQTYNRLSQEKGQPVITASKVCLMTPLPFDPGERWDCGTNLDWCGQIVEAITDQRLGDIFKTRIFEPIGIQDMTFELTDAMRQRLAGIHAKGADGSLTPMDFELPAKPEVHMGGHGLRHGRRLPALYPDVVERRRGKARPHAEGGDRAHGGKEPFRDKKVRRLPVSSRRCATTRSFFRVNQNPGR